MTDFVGDMVERLLCPVRALSCYLERTRELSPRPPAQFVSCRRLLKVISKTAISFFFRKAISGAGAVRADVGPTISEA